jgi:formylglycine-generating enzyme required for sulfatase activity
LLVPQIDYRDPRFQFKGDLPTGMERCPQHPNCYIHLKDQSHMVWIPDGQFIASDGNEIKIQRLEEGAFIDKYPVTNAQYVQFLNASQKFDNHWIDLQGSYKNEACRIQKQGNNFVVKAEYARHPVNFVSFYGAEAYAVWAGKEIPSEWLWEKAGRGIDGRTYPWGDAWDWEKCNSGEHWAKKDLSKSEDWKEWNDSPDRLLAHITPVETFEKESSPFGVVDLAGNVWEWTRELWKKDETWRLVRGGAFSNDRVDARLAYRSTDLPGARHYFLGFRLSRTS